MIRLVVAGLLCLGLAAQNRAIRPADPGPQRLDVDLALLGATRNALADLRIRDGAGREVPYVLVPPDPRAAVWVPARLLPLPATKTTSGLELDLGAPLSTSRLRLEGLRPPFLKRFRLEGSGDRQRWTELVSAGSLFDLPGEGLRLLEVDFPAGDYRYLRIVWDDRASAPAPAPRAAFLLKAASAPVLPMAELPFLRRPSEPGVSRFTLRLPGPRVPLRALVLTVAGDGPLLREAQVTEPRLSASSLAPRSLGAARLRRVPGGAAFDLRIPVEVPEGSEIDLRVQDGDNPGLELTGVRAELEPQPWIYFEARDGGPLTATCGDARLRAPSYDLEARRDQLSRAPAARASWGPEAAAPPAPAAALDGGVGASLDAAGFRFRRQVPAGAPGLSALALDAHVLATSPRLQDLRLLDAGGRQIPYLLESRDEPLSLPLAWPAGTTRDRVTTYRIRLPQAGLPASRLVLETGARVFRRRVRVLDADPAQVRAVAEWSHADPGAPAQALVIPLPGAGPDLAVEVEEGDNQPLPIASARLLLPSWRLRFFRPGDAFQLCYGRDLEAPDYDMALLAGRLREAPAQEIVLAAGTEPAPAAGAPLKAVFWGALVIAVAGLLYMLARVLGKD
ncbi:DUF3999 family protein [Mesoterricola silvestris]|uniref:F5/8 type C domain-containing protein n=1 Tax=Mesoterricola silvestris TaxID=2927979 RepID=A0AA48HAA4_9BACT|nr:DUF3999 family protein [Mesoterricola silvestris]BDU74628.1 hypothetical protein METEAL_38020 [Mesoterricola silvestris]